jgi:hypothetical protein
MRISTLFLILLAGPVQAEAPLSAIDWLSQSVTPVAQPIKPKAVEPAVTSGALPEDVSVSVLGGPNADAVGLLSSRVTGLPHNLWGMGGSADIVALIGTERNETLPALRQLLVTLLLAEADPPVDSAGGVLLRARVDKLLDLGALDQAEALIAAAGPGDAELFRRAFDVALLTGSEDRACKVMQATATLAPTFPARIFCLARSGDWNAAALSLRTGVALGQITPDEDILLARFLDAEAEPETAPPVPARLTPLAWRMFEAIGEPLPTSNLPLAFAHADLSDRAGWKAQIEAAERLARVGAIAPNQLLGLYTERDPAASGGVWDRVAAFQDFDAALTTGDALRVAATLQPAWAAMEEVELEVPFAALYGEKLGSVALTGDTAKVAFRVGLLSPTYEKLAKLRVTADVMETFLQGLAKGSVEGLVAPDSLGRAIAPAFVLAEPSATSLQMLEEGRLGEAILMAIDQISMGVQGELRGVTDGLALLRHVGLEDVARRTALQLMILERRG